MQKLDQIVQTLDDIAPMRFAEAWDNVGLIVGDPSQDISRVMLCIDYTSDVAREAENAKCELIVAYHPPIFEGIKKVVGGNSSGLIFDAIRRGIAIYSPHTALDVAEGGTNDLLADAIGLTERGPLRLVEPKASQYKLVTFVPVDAVEKVSAALFDAGAGRIGKYSHCSFRTPGTGTFFGEAGTNPTVGLSGRLEEAPEIRVETVAPISKLPEILKALRDSHPYEEPAFDLVQLAAAPEKLGQGRIGTMPATSRSEIFNRIKRELQIEHLLIAGLIDGNITRAACCAGACGDMLDDAIKQKAELYLTGEMRHHDAIKAAASGMTVVCTLHSNSERAVLKRLAARLSEKVKPLEVRVSEADRDPFAIR